jgi:hypothetical protein
VREHKPLPDASETKTRKKIKKASSHKELPAKQVKRNAKITTRSKIAKKKKKKKVV